MGREDTQPLEDWEAEFDRLAFEDDGRAADEALARGTPVHVEREDTPEGFVVRIDPDGHEELVRVDWEKMRQVLG